MRARFALLFILIFLTACSTGTPAPAETAAAPLPSATLAPTAGPTTTPPAPLVILVIPAEMNEAQSKAYQKAVYDLAQAQGYRFVVLNKLTAADLEPTLKVVVALTPEMEIAKLAAAAPQTQFLAIDFPNLQPGGNLSVLGGQTAKIDQVAFIAGYIAAMVTQDYHTGALLVKDSPEAATIMTAFRAGHEFYCGLCSPYAGPFLEYPLFQDIPKDAKPNEYGAYADLLIRKQVDTLFLQPGVDVPELLEYLPTVGVLMIGTQTPSKELGGWVVSLQPDYLEALQTAFPALLAGQGGQVFPAPLSFNNANPDLFTPGKEQDARRTLDDVLAGFISTGVK